MGFDVISIDELADFPKFTRVRCFEFFNLLDHQVYVALRARSQYQICTVGADGFLPLFAHPSGHDDNHGIAFSSAHAGGGYACIASRAFDDAHARTQVASPFCLGYQKRSHTIFDAAAWFEIFDLGYNGGFCITHDTPQAYHWGHSSRIKTALGNTATTLPLT